MMPWAKVERRVTRGRKAPARECVALTEDDDEARHLVTFDALDVARLD
jgi:hypothetical protein